MDLENSKFSYLVIQLLSYAFKQTTTSPATWRRPEYTLKVMYNIQITYAKNKVFETLPDLWNDPVATADCYSSGKTPWSNQRRCGTSVCCLGWGDQTQMTNTTTTNTTDWLSNVKHMIANNVELLSLRLFISLTSLQSAISTMRSSREHCYSYYYVCIIHTNLISH